MPIYLYGQENKSKLIKYYETDIARVFNKGDLCFKKVESTNWEDYGERIEYIRGTGSQYIFTDYLPNGNTNIEVDFELEDEYAKMIFGTRFDFTKTNGCLFYADTSIRYYAGFDSSNVAITYTGTSLKLSEKFNIKMSKDYLLFNDIPQNSGYFGDYSDLNPEELNNLAIFTTRTIGEGIDTRIAKGKLYSFIVRENDTIVMNLIPIRLTKQSYGSYSKGSFVMWDTISNTIPLHIGTFIGETEEPYILTDYTIATGLQHTDLKIQNNSNLIVRGKARATIGSGESFVYGSRESYLVDTNSIFFSTLYNDIFLGMGANWKTHRNLVDVSDWVEFYIDKNTNIVNGIEVKNTSIPNFASDLNLYLATLNQRIGLEARKFKGDIEYLSIEQDGVKLIDLKSCVFSETGEAGFWDYVSNTFIKSDTNTPYLAGEISLEQDFSYPSTMSIRENGDIVIVYEDELNPDWNYNPNTGDVVLTYEGEVEPPIYIDQNGNIVIEEEVN